MLCSAQDNACLEGRPGKVPTGFQQIVMKCPHRLAKTPEIKRTWLHCTWKTNMDCLSDLHTACESGQFPTCWQWCYKCHSLLQNVIHYALTDWTVHHSSARICEPAFVRHRIVTWFYLSEDVRRSPHVIASGEFKYSRRSVVEGGYHKGPPMREYHVPLKVGCFQNDTSWIKIAQRCIPHHRKELSSNNEGIQSLA